MSRIGFIGLGRMGGPMAAHLAKRGHDMKVYSRREATSYDWTGEHGGVVAFSPAEAAQGSDVVVLCVGADKDVLEVVMGPNGVLTSMKPGAILVDHTTVGPDTSLAVAKACQAAGVHFIEAPVTGGNLGAMAGTLTAFISCPEALESEALKIMGYYVLHPYFVGDYGQGARAKLVNQVTQITALIGVVEGLTMMKAAGLPEKAMLEALKTGVAQSWYMANRSSTMVAREFDFGFAVDWMVKDLRLAVRECDRHGVQVPGAQLALSRLEALQALGYHHADVTSLICLDDAPQDRKPF